MEQILILHIFTQTKINMSDYEYDHITKESILAGLLGVKHFPLIKDLTEESILSNCSVNTRSVANTRCSDIEAIEYKPQYAHEGVFHLQSISGHVIQFSMTDGTPETIDLAKRIATGKYMFIGLFVKDNDSVLRAMLNKLTMLKGFNKDSFALFDNDNSHILVAKPANLRREKRAQERAIQKELTVWKRLFF